MSFSSLWPPLLPDPRVLATLLQHGGLWSMLALFALSSLLMVWRLDALERRGFEGTVLGTLVMPYCSGLSNLVFALVMARAGHGGAAVMENGLVNNVTNLTLLLGLPALLGGLRLIPAATTRGQAGRSGRVARLNRLALLLTLLAALFFIAVTWALSRDGVLDRRDGLVLVALFGFWQVVHLFEVLKSNVRQGRRMGYLWLMDLALILAAAGGIYHATETLAMWVGSLGRGTFVYKHMGVLSGLLMVLPNAALALGYNLAGRPEVVYSSQVGDGHICIPMAIGLYALIHPMQMPPLFELGAFLIVAAVLTHILLIAFLGRLPRMAGALLLAVYGVFLWKNFA